MSTKRYNLFEEFLAQEQSVIEWAKCENTWYSINQTSGGRFYLDCIIIDAYSGNFYGDNLYSTTPSYARDLRTLEGRLLTLELIPLLLDSASDFDPPTINLLKSFLRWRLVNGK